MKIWYHPQISMRSYRTNKLLTNNDAQFIKAKEVLEWIVVRGHHVILNLPRNAELPDNYVRYYNTMMTISGYDNAYRNRYDFSAFDIKERIEYYQPDIIWTEIPEFVNGYRSIVGDDIPIVATFEHFEERYILRQIEGFLNADTTVFPTLQLYSRFMTMAEKVLNGVSLTTLSKIHPKVWGNFVSEDEVLSKKHIVTEKLHRYPDPLRILFPSRLSDYSRTKWANFLSIIGKLLNKGYRVEICNPSEVEIPPVVDSLKDNANLIFHSNVLNRTQWLNTIARSHVAVILYSFDEFYSVGATELLSMGTKLVTYESQALEGMTKGIKGLLHFIDERSLAHLDLKIESAIITPVIGFDQQLILDRISGKSWAPRIFSTLEKTLMSLPSDMTKIAIEAQK